MPHSMRKHLSIVIATRDRPQTLRECLERVVSEADSEVEVIVVDNSEDEISSAMVVGEYSQVSYLRADPGRRNPAEMRNLGIGAAQGSILAFIDDDTLVWPGWLQRLRLGFSSPDIGGIVGRIVESAAPEVMTAEIGRIGKNGRMISNFNNTIEHVVEVHFVHGCNMAFSRPALEAAGLFDPWFGITYEETDLSIRVREAGYKLLFVPGMTVQHLMAPRPKGVTERSSSSHLLSRYRSARSLCFLCASHFGVSSALAEVAFVKLPGSQAREFLQRPSASTLYLALALLGAGVVGHIMAGLRWIGLHKPPSMRSMQKCQVSPPTNLSTDR